MKQEHANGKTFKPDDRGRGVDEDGFAVSSVTFITNIRTCVSVNTGGEMIRVRGTNDKTLNELSFTREEWAAFIAGVKLGEFDI